MVAKIILKAGHDKPLRQRHPWVFSGAIMRTKGDPQDGDIVDVINGAGDFLGRGYFNAKSQIVVRILTFDLEQEINGDFWRESIAASVARRTENMVGTQTNAVRLVNAEADFLPGLIVDRYGDYLVVQFLTLGVDVRKQEIAEILQRLLNPEGIYERSDVDVRKKEGLTETRGVLIGKEPPDRFELLEDNLRFLVDLKQGHKTGFYLDQRSNRQRMKRFCQNKDVLNLFAYTGAFAATALSAGAASTVNVDSSGPALDLARANLALNEFKYGDEDFVVADVFSELRKLRAEKRQFDLIVADPPKLVFSQPQLHKAARAYKDLNLVAMQVMKPGGYLATFSCSGLVSADLFQKIVFSAAVDAQRQVQIVEKLSQSPDHPISLTFPESEYLKGFICRVL